MNVKRILPLLMGLFVTGMSTVLAQPEPKPVRLTKNQGDCIGAYLIRDTIFGPVLSPEGPGNKMEIQGYELGDPHWFQQEHNTVWYRIKIPYTTTMWFDIVPLNPGDDFDFLLYQNPTPSFCNRIREGDVTPVRTNISRVASTNGGATGLSPDATEEYVPSGPGSPYSKALEVTAGDELLLVIDNPFKANEGHTIYIHYGKKKSNVYTRPAGNDGEDIELEPKDLNFTILDDKTGEPIIGRLLITGGGGDGDVIVGVSDYVYKAQMYKSYTIRAESEGYMFTTAKVTVYKENKPVEIRLKKIEPGVKVTLSNIKFEGDAATILETSQKDLDALLGFMEQNPNVRIEIGGHVNAPKSKNKGKYKKLSKARAEAVYNYLVEKGITRSRMTFVGYGNSQMIYADPISDHQEESNRRVEVKVISN